MFKTVEQEVDGQGQSRWMEKDKYFSRERLKEQLVMWLKEQFNNLGNVFF